MSGATRSTGAPSPRSALLLLLLALAGGGGAALHAQEASPAVVPQQDSALEAQARAIASELRCVVCQGLSVEDSPSELAQEMKQLVREQLAQGKTPEEVKAYFVGRYGEFVLLQPEPRGFNLVVYVLPFLALVVGGWILVGAVRSWTRRAEEGEDSPDEPAEAAVGGWSDPTDPTL